MNLLRWFQRALTNRAITRVSAELAASREDTALMVEQYRSGGRLVDLHRVRRKEDDLIEELAYLHERAEELRSRP